MSTAILLSGHMRTWTTCAHTFRHHVYRTLPKPVSWYVSTVNDEQCESWKLIGELFPDDPAFASIVESQPDIVEPHEKVRFEPFARSVPLQAVLRQLWQLNHCWKFYAAAGAQDDVIVRLRPDLFWHSYSACHIPGDDVALTPWWGRFGGVNDRFAVMGRDAAEAYHTTFENLDHLLDGGCPLHPESLIRQSMLSKSCVVTSRVKALFSTLRLTGEMRPPEINPSDMVEASMPY